MICEKSEPFPICCKDTTLFKLFQEKNNFFYEIENFKQNFLVLGEKYSYNIKNKIFQFSYILFDENHNEINKIRISIENV